MANATQVSSALATAVKTVEIRSRWSPPYQMSTTDLISGPTSPWMAIMAPTVVLDGGLVGKQVIAPGGLPGPDEWKWNLLMAGGAAAFLLAGGAIFAFGAGVRAGRRQARRSRAS